MKEEERQQQFELAETLLSEQNFVAAIISGAIATVLAAGIYAVMTAFSGGTSYSFMAAGIGAAIGFTMQFLGRGIDGKFAVVASVYAVLGCVLGNLLAVVLMISKADQVSPLTVISSIPTGELLGWVFADLQLMDLVFWMAAVAGAAYFVKRRLSREEGFALYTYNAEK